MHSFIFNFKSYWRHKLGLLILLILFTTLELTVFRNLNFYGQSSGFIGQLDTLQESFSHAKKQNITYAVFGDSQSLDALRPDLMAAEANLEKDSLFNFSITGGKAYDIYHTYLTYRNQMPALKKVIIVVNEHQLNSSAIDEDIKFRYYAGLKDRFKVMNKNNYGELLIGWGSKAFDMRTIWSKMLDQFITGKLKAPPKWQPGGLQAETYTIPQNKSISYAKSTADRWFKDFDLNGLQADSFQRLLADLKSRGVEITVLKIPRSEEFETAVKEKYGEQQREFDQQVKALTDLYGGTYYIMSNAGLTLQDDFRDTNHVNPKGASIISRNVARLWLRP
ncbi:hypothetical protein [Paenibacillus glycanilyticus]|uniref:hypothetical protein n=1 Tax=Paenibacillus glycanilyticus TaxID=126569 RepID=UPI000FDA876C|nr:hypothetical protein [Paenibacillus glycanilyticus]